MFLRDGWPGFSLDGLLFMQTESGETTMFRLRTSGTRRAITKKNRRGDRRFLAGRG